jgi:hypothetical protein
VCYVTGTHANTEQELDRFEIALLGHKRHQTILGRCSFGHEKYQDRSRPEGGDGNGHGRHTAFGDHFDVGLGVQQNNRLALEYNLGEV